MTLTVALIALALPLATYVAARATLRRRAMHDPDGPRTLQHGFEA
jgi:hypothetical protein